MSADLPPLELRPLRVRRAREVFAAPELERYLGQRGAELQYIDQVEALRVRIERGLTVLRDRANAASRVIDQRRRVAIGLIIIALAGCVAGALRSQSVVIAVSVLIALACAIYLALIARDGRTLRSMHGRYDEVVRNATDLRSLATVSEAIWAEIEILAAPSSSSTIEREG
ncbi:MAG TPA: hypothetical protein VK116_00795 [Planctomycetota bacterium]|nr:hypothetical protein [Planctomycetota bacterium]